MTFAEPGVSFAINSAFYLPLLSRGGWPDIGELHWRNRTRREATVTCALRIETMDGTVLLVCYTVSFFFSPIFRSYAHLSTDLARLGALSVISRIFLVWSCIYMPPSVVNRYPYPLRSLHFPPLLVGILSFAIRWILGTVFHTSTCFPNTLWTSFVQQPKRSRRLGLSKSLSCSKAISTISW